MKNDMPISRTLQVERKKEKKAFPSLDRNPLQGKETTQEKGGGGFSNHSTTDTYTTRKRDEPKLNNRT